MYAHGSVVGVSDMQSFDICRADYKCERNIIRPPYHLEVSNWLLQNRAYIQFVKFWQLWNLGKVTLQTNQKASSPWNYPTQCFTFSKWVSFASLTPHARPYFIILQIIFSEACDQTSCLETKFWSSRVQRKSLEHHTCITKQCPWRECGISYNPIVPMNRLDKTDCCLMTDSICHSSLPRTVLEKVTDYYSISYSSAHKSRPKVSMCVY